MNDSVNLEARHPQSMNMTTRFLSFIQDAKSTLKVTFHGASDDDKKNLRSGVFLLGVTLAVVLGGKAYLTIQDREHTLNMYASLEQSIETHQKSVQETLALMRQTVSGLDSQPMSSQRLVRIKEGIMQEVFDMNGLDDQSAYGVQYTVAIMDYAQKLSRIDDHMKHLQSLALENKPSMEDYQDLNGLKTLVVSELQSLEMSPNAYVFNHFVALDVIAKYAEYRAELELASKGEMPSFIMQGDTASIQEATASELNHRALKATQIKVLSMLNDVPPKLGSAYMDVLSKLEKGLMTDALIDHYSNNEP